MSSAAPRIAPMAPLAATSPCIGVFDSGVGGLTVLAALRRRLPDAPLLYAADSAYAPYGERDPDYVVWRSTEITRFLLAQGAQVIVIACNTATAQAVAALRQLWPGVPFVGIEPAIKPALAAGSGNIGVLATPGTLSSAKFRALLETQRLHAPDARVLLQPCPGLAEAIETRGPHAPRTVELVQACCAPLAAAGCDTVVLGCTHYPLVADAIRAALDKPGLRLLDPAEAVAAQTARVAAALPPGSPDQPALRVWSNGQPELLQRIATACGLDVPDVLPLPASPASASAA